ncbi:MAG: DUF4113 domain-containing protein [Methylocystaceae bacterium]|nr:DUF4113 domain-containing protein [Methylocystaceae bacterium]
MHALDTLNKKYGRGTLVICSAGLRQGWSLRRSFLSQQYTTNWQDLPHV